MQTNYVKNFDREQFHKLYEKLSVANSEKEPFWRGTVFIGNQPLYIECHVKWIADKINSYFVDARQNYQNLKDEKAEFMYGQCQNIAQPQTVSVEKLLELY